MIAHKELTLMLVKHPAKALDESIGEINFACNVKQDKVF
jgi:hypothetical protein